MTARPEPTERRRRWAWTLSLLLAALICFGAFVLLRSFSGEGALESRALVAAMLCFAAAVLTGLWQLLSRFGLWLQLPAVLGLLLVFGTATASFITLGLRAKNAEAMANLNKLKKAQIAFHRKHGVYRAAQLAPEPDTDGALFWPDPLPEGSGWADVGWHLVGVRSWCQYEVQLQGDGFIARGFCDVDHDGKVGRFEVTEDSPPRRITPHY